LENEVQDRGQAKNYLGDERQVSGKNEVEVGRTPAPTRQGRGIKKNPANDPFLLVTQFRKGKYMTKRGQDQWEEKQLAKKKGER